MRRGWIALVLAAGVAYSGCSGGGGGGGSGPISPPPATQAFSVALSPSSGSAQGGTSVTVMSAGGPVLGSGLVVTVGGAPVRQLQVVSPAVARFEAPPNPDGNVSTVQPVRVSQGSWVSTNAVFTYQAVAPTLTAVSPPTGSVSGGTFLTLTGTGFAPGATVTVGGAAATVVTVQATTLGCSTPPGSLGVVDVRVTNSDGQSAALSGAFTYVLPPPPPPLSVTGITPAVGEIQGGTAVTITGTSFNNDATVAIGGVPATGVTVVSSTQIACVTSANGFGPADVVVTNVSAVTSATLSSGYFYEGNTAPVRVNDGTLPFSTAWKRGLQAVRVGGALVAAWDDFRGDGDVYSARSTDGGATWSANRQVSDGTPGYTQSEVALRVSAAGTVLCAWDEVRLGGGVWVNRSTDGGQSWGAGVRVDDGTTFAAYPFLATDPSTGDVLCVWTAQGTGTYGTRFARSSDDGQTWSANVLVSDDASAFKTYPQIAADAAGVLVCAWADQRGGQDNVVFARSTDGGVTWSANAQLNDLAGTVWTSSPTNLAVTPAGTFVCAWIDSRNLATWSVDLYAARSTDGGVSWSSGQRVNTDTNTSIQHTIGLVVDGSAIWISWAESLFPGPANIRYARSTDEGASFPTEGEVASSSYAAGVLAPIGSDVTCVFNKDGATLASTRSTDGGTTWSAQTTINDDTEESLFQRDPKVVELPGGALVCVFTDDRFRAGRGDVFATRSTDGGVTWSADVKVNDSAAQVVQRWPTIAVTPAGVVVCAWIDERSGTPEVFFSSSADGGATWSANVLVCDVIVGGAAREWPSLVVEDSGAIACAWKDYRMLGWDVYLSRSTDGGATWGADVRVSASSSSLLVSGAAEMRPTLVAAPGGGLACAWADQRSGGLDVYAATSANGASWTEVRVNDVVIGPVTVLQPTAAFDAAGRLVVAWADDRSGSQELYASRSSDGGATFSPAVRVNDSPILLVVSDGLQPHMTRTPSGLAIVWADRRLPSRAVWLSHSADGGATWSANRSLSAQPLLVDFGSPTTPHVAPRASGGVHAVWAEYRGADVDAVHTRAVHAP